MDIAIYKITRWGSYYQNRVNWPYGNYHNLSFLVVDGILYDVTVSTFLLINGSKGDKY